VAPSDHSNFFFAFALRGDYLRKATYVVQAVKHSFHLRNRSFHRHQPLAQIFIDTRGVVSSCHRGIPARSDLALVMLPGEARVRHPTAFFAIKARPPARLLGCD